MNFKNNVSESRRKFLIEKTKQYEQEMEMTLSERKALYEWVGSGRYPYDNEYGFLNADGEPLDFVNGMRKADALRESIRQTSEEAKVELILSLYLHIRNLEAEVEFLNDFISELPAHEFLTF